MNTQAIKMLRQKIYVLHTLEIKKILQYEIDFNLATMKVKNACFANAAMVFCT